MATSRATSCVSVLLLLSLAFPATAFAQESPVALPLTPPPPTVATWRPGIPVPTGYRAVEKPRKGLVIGGLVTLGIGLGTSIFGGALMLSKNVTEGTYAVIPFAGTFAALSGVNKLKNDGTWLGESYRSPIASALVIGGVAQVTGAVLLFVGLESKTVLEPIPRAFAWRPTPILGHGMTGFGLSGSF